MKIRATEAYCHTVKCIGQVSTASCLLVASESEEPPQLLEPGALGHLAVQIDVGVLLIALLPGMTASTLHVEDNGVYLLRIVSLAEPLPQRFEHQLHLQVVGPLAHDGLK